MPVRSEILRFGVFELDLTEGVLIKGGHRINLQEQPFRLLSILVQHPGETVTREQLRQALWPADTFVDFDRGLNAAMAKLRHALGDSADNPRFVETQARRGYRFIAPVTAPVENVVVAKADPPKSRFTAHRYWVAAAAAGILLVGVGVFYLRNPEPGGAAAEPLPRPLPLTTYPGNQWEPTFSPEGTRVAFAWDEPGKRASNIYVKLIGSSDPVRLTTDDRGDFSPAWSPDGRYIAFLRSLGPLSTAVMLIPSLGGPERELSRLQLDGSVILAHRGWTVPSPLLTWSPDNKWLLAATGGRDAVEVIRISIESGEKTKLKLFEDSHGVDSTGPLGSGDAGLAVSPDGRKLAFVHMIDVPNSRVFVVNLSDDMLPVGAPKSVHDRSFVAGVAWSPNGHGLLVSGHQRVAAGDNNELWRVPVDSQKEPVRLNVNDDTLTDIAVSKTGQRLVYSRYSAGEMALWRMDLRSTHLEGGPLMVSTRYQERPSYSSDGNRIAFDSDRSGSVEIWIANADGSRTVQLTSFGNGWSGSPRWSPDDRQIAFDSSVSGKWNVYIVPSQGGKPVRFTQGSGTSIRPSWSHDGKWIYYCASENSGPQIWKKAVAGGPAIQITQNGGCNQQESADGAFLYYLKPDERALWRVPANGGEETEVLALKRTAEFRLGAHGAYFIDTAVPVVLKYLEFSTGAVKTLGTLPGLGNVSTGLAVSPDEHWLIYAKSEVGGSQLMLVEKFR